MNMLQGPTPQQLQEIKDELGENSERMQNSLELLQKWISCQTHLPQDLDNNLLSVFLRGCKHNLERTKKKIEMYFVTRASIPELFLNRDPTEDSLQRVTKMIKFTPMPKLSPEGNRITVCQVLYDENIEWDMCEVLRYIFMTADVRVAEESAISGDIFIYDLEQLKASHLLKYMTPILKKAIISAQNAYPQRLKQLHILNAPAFVDKVLTVTKAVVNEKIRQRFIVHKHVEGLLKYLPSDCLPVEYCGTAGKYDSLVDDWTCCLIKHNKWFQQQDSVKAVGYFPLVVSHASCMEANGLSGSFRKLEID